MKSFYEIESEKEVYKQIQENENILILLDEMKPCLLDMFEDSKYCLGMNFEPEMDDRFIILSINVSKERFNNGIGKDIREFNSKFHDLRRNLEVYRELLVMPGVQYV